MMNFGSAIEALKAGEVISRGRTRYRHTPGSGHITRIGPVDASGIEVSTTAASFSITEVLAEDWRIEGYAQEGRPYGNEQAEPTRDLGSSEGHPGAGAGSVEVEGAAFVVGGTARSP
jgi:hypothetical protein